MDCIWAYEFGPIGSTQIKWSYVTFQLAGINLERLMQFILHYLYINVKKSVVVIIFYLGVYIFII